MTTSWSRTLTISAIAAFLLLMRSVLPIGARDPSSGPLAGRIIKTSSYQIMLVLMVVLIALLEAPEFAGDSADFGCLESLCGTPKGSIYTNMQRTSTSLWDSGVNW